jgi:hypothetical protein
MKRFGATLKIKIGPLFRRDKKSPIREVGQKEET